MAIEDLHKAIDLKPDYASAFYDPGLAHRSLGDLLISQRYIERALEIYDEKGMFKVDGFDSSVPGSKGRTDLPRKPERSEGST